MQRFLCCSTIALTIALVPLPGRAQWVQTNGPYGAWVFCIASLGNDIFIGTEGGIFESTDQGSSWQRSSNGLPPDLYVYSLATRGSNIFAGTFQYGVYRSTDSGGTWASVSSGLPNRFSAGSLGTSSRSIFAPDGQYLYRSSNDGNQWTRVDTNLTKLSRPQAVLTVDTITYAAGAWITQTTDEGLTWTVTAVPPADTFWDIYSMANIGEVLFAVDRESGVLRSIDHGQTWNHAGKGLPYGYANCLATMGQKIFAGADSAVYHSTDSGVTWLGSLSGLPSGVNIITLASNGSELLAGFNGLGMFRSFDSGKTWSECNNGIIDTKVQAITRVGDTTIVGTTVGVFLTTDNGVSWQPKRNGLTDYNIGSLLIDGENFYAGSESGYLRHSLFLSSDRGESWSCPDSGLDEIRIGALIRSGPNLIAGGWDYPNNKFGLYKSTAGAYQWSPCNVSIGYFLGAVFNGFVNFGSTVVASSDAFPFVSYDNGNSWMQSSQGIPYHDQLIVWAIGINQSKIFAHFTPNSYYQSFGIFISDDSGKTWYHALDTIFPERAHVTCFASFSNNLFAATDSSGIFLSSDDGAHWTHVSEGLGDSNVLSLAVQGNELLAGTASSGVWRRPLAEMIGSNSVEPTLSTDYSVRAYPNPFSQLTTISFTSRDRGTVEVTIVNLLGSEVARVFDGELDAGEHSFTWDARGMGPGVYECVVRTNGRAERVAIMLVR